MKPETLPWWVLLSTSLAMFAVFLDTTILFVAFRAISVSFTGVSVASLSWILNAYTIAFAATLIPAGRMADRWGRRRTFLFAVVVFTLASVACGLAPSVGLLVAARVLQAVGAAALVPSSLALVLETFPRSKIPMAVAMWSAIGAVAGAVGPSLGSLVVEHLGWRWVFYVNLPVGLVSYVLAWKVLPTQKEVVNSPLPDPLGMGILVASLATMAYSLVATEGWGWISARFFATFAFSLALLGLFVWRCGRVANPLLDFRLFASTSSRLANAGTLLFSIGFSAIFLGNILFLTSVWHYELVRAGMAVSIGPLVVATTAPFFGQLAGRIGQRPILLGGGMVWSSGAFLLWWTATAEPHWLTVFFPAALLMALGVSLCLPQLASASVQGLPADSFAAGSAVNQAIRNLGGTLGVALVLACAGGTSTLASFYYVWWLLMGCGVGVSALAAFLPAGRPIAMSQTVIVGH